MFIGRHAGLPIAMEGALKLKEISYLHAEAFPAGEMKHGPIALIEEGSLVVALAPGRPRVPEDGLQHPGGQGPGRRVIAIGTEGSTADLKEHADHVLTLPERQPRTGRAGAGVSRCSCSPTTWPWRSGEDVDQPRNLAKTVTVE